MLQHSLQVRQSGQSMKMVLVAELENSHPNTHDEWLINPQTQALH
jgi:hypothetical protein